MESIKKKKKKTQTLPMVRKDDQENIQPDHQCKIDMLQAHFQ